MFANISNKNMGGLYKKFGYNGIILPTKINTIHIKTLWDKWYDFTVPEFKEYDETIADDIQICKCPVCGNEHASKKD